LTVGREVIQKRRLSSYAVFFTITEHKQPLYFNLQIIIGNYCINSSGKDFINIQDENTLNNIFLNTEIRE